MTRIGYKTLIKEWDMIIGARFRSSPSERAWTIIATGKRADGKKNVTLQRGTVTKTIVEATFRQHYYLVGGEKDVQLTNEFKRHNYKVVEA